MDTKFLKFAKIGGLSLALALVLTGCTLADLKSSKAKNLKPEEARAKAEQFINDNLMEPGSPKVTVDSITEESGLYKISVNLGKDENGNDKKVDSYLTKDAKTFYPQSFSMEDEAAAGGAETEENVAGDKVPVPSDLPKNDKPTVELFVMSHCPYGTQIEKGIIPVVEKLGNKIDFKLKFCDYAMHGEKELKEQLNQHCIQKNEPAKLLTYLKCFLKAGDSASCVNEAKIDSGKLASCVSSTDNEFQVMKKFNDKTGYKGSFPAFDVYATDNTKYGVGGSPTLIVNGAEAQSGRSSADLMATICSGFNNMPEACNEKLSAASPAPGFGEGTDNSGGAPADCGQ